MNAARFGGRSRAARGVKRGGLVLVVVATASAAFPVLTVTAQAETLGEACTTGSQSAIALVHVSGTGSTVA